MHPPRPTPAETHAPRLYMRAVPAGQVLFRRVGLVLIALLTAVLIFWLERDSLRDSSGKKPDLADVVYFTATAISTVGYGDIVPVGERARLVDALVVTPIRI